MTRKTALSYLSLLVLVAAAVASTPRGGQRPREVDAR